MGAFVGLLSFLLLAGGLLLPLQSEDFRDQMDFGFGGSFDFDFSFEFYLFQYKVVDNSRDASDSEAYVDGEEADGKILLMMGAILLLLGLFAILLSSVVGFIEHSEPAVFPTIAGAVGVFLSGLGFLFHDLGLGQFAEDLDPTLAIGGVLVILGLLTAVASVVVPLVVPSNGEAQATESS